MDDEETRVQLLRGLRHQLQSFQVGPETRTGLVGKSIGLLARYHAYVREFYEWFCSDFAMVVLILDGLLDERVWPEEVACDADRFTSSLRAHFKRVFDCLVHRKGQGVWVQAEYGAGKTHFLGARIDLLIWRDADVWDAIHDAQIKSDYAAALAKVKMFPVAFSLRGMGESSESDSLMRIFEEQIRERIRAFAPALDEQVKVISPELAAHWYAEEARKRGALRTQQPRSARAWP